MASTGSRWRGRLLALALGWGLVEFLLLPAVTAFAPLRLLVRLPAPLQVLGASSKAGFLPRDYVLVLGDSYAEGHGDWLTEALRAGGRPPFQATHLLHQRSGRDVVTFGSGGADNVSSTAFLASKRCAALWRLGLEEPRDVFVYFYEGNDLNEGLRLARKRFGLKERGLEGFTDAELDAAIARRAAAGTRRGLVGTLLAPYLLHDLVGGYSAGGLEGADRRQLRFFEARPVPMPEANVFALGERYYQFEPIAQGPGLELDERELAFALRLLERALVWTRARFPDARVQLVHLPSPASCYELLSPRVRVQTYEGRSDLYPAELVRARTDELRRRTRALAAALDLGYVDPTDELRARGRTELLHGPGDAKHFNRAGYAVLADCLARALADAAPGPRGQD